MANTATKVHASPNRLTYRLVGDGTVAGPTLANATLLADMVDGPLKDLWSLNFADQATMRNRLLGGAQSGVLADSAGGMAIVQLVVAVNDVTAQENQIAVDVDTDAVTATKAEINISMSDTTGQVAFLHILHQHSSIL